MISEIEPYNNYTGDGTTTQFDFDFFIEKKNQLVVYHTDENDVQTTLSYNIDYTINEVGNVNGSYIIFPLSGSSYNTLSSNEKLSLCLTLPIEQQSEYGTSSELDLKNVEKSLDYLTRIAQIQDRKIERSVKLPEGADSTSEDLINKTNVIYKNIDIINAVNNNATNINAVKNNETNINTCATNIDSINNASTNAAHSHIWAEGTDAQVQSLGGVHSSKGWSEIWDNRTIAFSVKDFGAKGDGTTDDTTAINTTLDEKETTFIPDGIFLTDGTGVLNESINVKGNGIRSNIKSNSAGRLFNLQAGTDGSCIDSIYADGNIAIQSSDSGCTIFSGSKHNESLVKNITVQNSTIDSSGFDTLGSHRTKNLLWHNNRINGGYDTVADIVEGTNNFIVNNNFITSNALYGIAMDTADEVNYAPVHNGIINNNVIEIIDGSKAAGYIGIQNEDNEKVIISNEIIDCSSLTSQDVVKGIRCVSNSEQIIISNCILIGNNYSGNSSEAGIEIDNSNNKKRKKNVIINNCIFINWKRGINIYWGDNVTISNCKFYNCNSNAINIDSAGNNAQASPTMYIQISNCYFYNTPLNAVRFGSNYGGRAIMTNCLFENCPTSTIAADKNWTIDVFGDSLPLSMFQGGKIRLNGYLPASSVPTKFTFEKGEIIRNTNPSAGGYVGWVCVQAGTNATFSTNQTGSISSGSNSLTITTSGNLSNDFYIGQYITITGVSGRKKITAIDPSNKVMTLDSNADATVSDAEVAYSAAVFKNYGAIAS